VSNIAQKCIKPRIKNVCVKSATEQGANSPMHKRKPNIHATRDPRAWALMLARYREPTELAAVGRLTLIQSLPCVRMVLWDERRRRLISFREMHILTSVMNRRTAVVPNQA